MSWRERVSEPKLNVRVVEKILRNNFSQETANGRDLTEPPDIYEVKKHFLSKNYIIIASGNFSTTNFTKIGLTADRDFTFETNPDMGARTFTVNKKALDAALIKHYPNDLADSIGHSKELQ